jgi:hypothetical protein
MREKERKSVRFDALVKKSGQPEQATLWTKPDEDRDFMKAVKGGRVVTVTQHNVGTKKDFGVVGFHPEKNAAYLVFPKTLEPDEETKVIGIKYERVAPGTPRGPIFKPKKQGVPGIPMREERRNQVDSDEPKALEKTKKEPVLLKFVATVVIEATQSVEIEVKAKNKTEAARILKECAAELKINPEQSTVRRVVKSVKKRR